MLIHPSRRFCGHVVGLSLLGLFSTGCGGQAVGNPKAGAGPASVVVVNPVEKDLADFVEFTGRTDAVESVEIRARVSGYLKEIRYKPGKEVEAGAVMFEIDSRPYDAELLRAEGTLATAEASLKQASAELARAEDLHKKQISTQSDYDKAVADKAHADASVQSAQATVVNAKLNQDFTKVIAPIAGLTNRELITVGNLVTADTTSLTTIVSLDPIYAYFDVDERTLLDIQRRIREKKMDSARERDNVEVRMELANETGFPHVGVVDLVDNRIDAGTGTIQVRGRFPNEDRYLTPGLFVRVQFQMGPPRKRVLIPENALMQQQGQRFVYVVTTENKIERRNVTAGRHDELLRVIETGLEPGDQVVVKGQQRVRPGSDVKIASDPPPNSAVPAEKPAAKSH
ncbi:efflux RND transporter periplasmic adaptor subunit [Schlesneria paludicola]|uniref:efflux RND transporter periplasmic adaptor subunit n=1 Tax=Schlesneria paludicola TaxID=360056 RepID=UPI00029A75B1|nr:efflux RND transporter periplasmic adaptor subunit [Schlesneria paludicola]